MKKLIAFVLSCCMLLSALPVVLAAEQSGVTDGFSYFIAEEMACITAYEGSGDVVVPDALGGYPVVAVGNGAFSGNDALTGITLPDSLLSVGEDAFAECTALFTVTFGSSLETIADGAFRGCSALQMVFLPGTVALIGDGVFADCPEMLILAAPAGSYVETYAAQNSILFIETGKAGDILYYIAGNQLYLIGPGAVPSYASADEAPWAEQAADIEEVFIAHDVTAIGDYAFYGMLKLYLVLVDNSDITFGENVFYPDATPTFLGKNAGALKTYCEENEYTLTPAPNPETPAAPTVASASGTTVTLTPVTGCEYKMDEEEWQASNVFTEVDIAETHLFYQRYAASDVYACSDPSPATSYCKAAAEAPEAPTLSGYTADTVTLTAVDGYEYKMDEGSWQASNVFTEVDITETHLFYQRVAETDLVSASPSSDPLSFVKPTAEAPEAPTVASSTLTSVTLTPVAGCEYKMDDGEWQASNVFSDLDPGCSYTFYQRIAETELVCASPASDGTQADIPALGAPVLIAIDGSSVTLAETDGIEFSMDGITWQASGVFTDLPADTPLSFVRRRAAHGEQAASAASTALTVLIVSAPEIVRATATVVELVKHEGYEYSKNGELYQYLPILTNLPADADYSVYQRPSDPSAYDEVYYINGGATLIRLADLPINPSVDPAVLYGDCTGDEYVDAKDVTRLKKYLANRDVLTGESTIEISYPADDCNGDGFVDAKDVTRLKKYLANRDVFTGESTFHLGPDPVEPPVEPPVEDEEEEKPVEPPAEELPEEPETEEPALEEPEPEEPEPEEELPEEELPEEPEPEEQV